MLKEIDLDPICTMYLNQPDTTLNSHGFIKNLGTILRVPWEGTLRVTPCWKL